MIKIEFSIFRCIAQFGVRYLDITLERMLSLIPRKPDGKYVHGEKKKFCESIGAPPNIVSEWEAGKTKSYRNYIYAVSLIYNVSVEWLKGETDEKKPASVSADGQSEDAILFSAYKAAPHDVQEAIRLLLGLK